jgi:hypothetical protein
MITESIDHATLSRLASDGAVPTVQVVSQAGGWAVHVTYDSCIKQLAAQRSQKVRLFKRLESLVTYLKGLGLTRFDIDSQQFEPGAAKTHTRPDRAAALKQAHAANAYDQWFRQQVQSSMDDPRASVPDDEARVLFAAKKAMRRAHFEVSR